MITMDTEQDRVVEINVIVHMARAVAAITRCEQNAFSGMWTDVKLSVSGDSVKIVGPINKVLWILRELNPRTPWRQILLDDDL